MYKNKNLVSPGILSADQSIVVNVAITQFLTNISSIENLMSPDILPADQSIVVGVAIIQFLINVLSLLSFFSLIIIILS